MLLFSGILAVCSRQLAVMSQVAVFVDGSQTA